MRAPATVFCVRSRKIWQSAAGYKGRDVSGKFVEQVVSLDDPVEISPRGQARHRRPRRDRGQIIAVDVGDVKRNLARARGGGGQTPALDGREESPHDVHFRNYRAATNQGAVDR